LQTIDASAHGGNYYIPTRARDTEQIDETNGFAAILEENEDDISRGNSPAFLDMSGDLDMLGEKRDGESIPVMPWRGLLKKSNSKVNVND